MYDETYHEQSLALMLVDQEDVNIRSCCEILSQFNYRNLLFDTPSSLLNHLETNEPDILFLDSDLISLDLFQKIRGIIQNKHVPIFILAAQLEYKGLLAYLIEQVDDVILKSHSSVLLKAKLRLFAKVNHRLHQYRDQYQQFARYRQQILREQEVAFNLYEKILRVNYLETSAVKSFVSDHSLFNGDIVLVGNTPDNRLHILLGDFSGFGISACVAAAPTAETFYGMTGKGFDILEITQEINRKLCQLLSADMFLAATIIALDPETKALHTLNCGMPEQILINRLNKTYQAVESNNFPLGIVDNINLNIQSYEVGQRHYFYMLNRAVSDVTNTEGEAVGSSSVIDCLLQTNDSIFECFSGRLQQYYGNKKTEQSSTFVELCCDVDNVPWKSAEEDNGYGYIEALSWKTMMEFDICTLRKLNPVPIIVNAMMEIQGLQKHRQTIFLIVTELFANALDHGLLKLDSRLKQTPEGFMHFYELREKRLKTVKKGHVRIKFNHQPTETGGQLVIKVKDSGEGFNFNVIPDKPNENSGFCGRGIALVKSLCSSISYHGGGNRVTAVFDWDH